METENKKQVEKLALDELRKEYGLGDNSENVTRGSCTLSLKCAYHTISCTSSSGDCATVKKDLVIDDQIVDRVTVKIVCDGKEYTCDD